MIPLFLSSLKNKAQLYQYNNISRNIMKHRILTVFIAISYIIANGVFCQEGSPKVKISSGELQGTYRHSRENRKYSAFLGIPYGQAKRFQLAEAPEKWQGVRNATAFGEECPQKKPLTAELLFIGSEDCLYLNVYSPKEKMIGFGEMPVMVFIHGGGFQGGSSNFYMEDYFMDEDVVLVTINYRLGLLGFLNFGDGEVESNLGLKDQTLALKWVQHNIRHFGGNPHKVTIFGESAGSASTHYHVLSSLSKGLFHGAIMQSGVAINPWAHSSNPGKTAFAHGNALGCNTQNSTELINCLKQKDFKDICNVTNTLAQWPGDAILPVPSTERPGKNTKQIFLDDDPINILKSKKYNKVPVMFTVNEEEGLGFIIESAKFIKDINEDYLRILPIILLYENYGYSSSQLNEISNKVRQFYFGNKEIGPATFQNQTNMFTDRAFATGIEQAISIHATTNNVYNGFFTYKGVFSVGSLYGITRPAVMHGDELQYFFRNDIFPKYAPGSMVENASKYFVSLWTHFAKTGNPGAKWTRLQWEPVNTEETEKTGLSWWNLNFPPEKLVNPFKESVQFWNATLQNTK